MGTATTSIVIDDLDLFGTGTQDALVFFATVGRPYDPTGDLGLAAVLAGPPTMFNSTALPGNLDFLPQAALRFTAFQFRARRRR